MVKPATDKWTSGRSNFGDGPNSITAGTTKTAASVSQAVVADPTINGNLKPDGNFDITRPPKSDTAAGSKVSVRDVKIDGSLKSDGDMDVTR